MAKPLPSNKVEITRSLVKHLTGFTEEEALSQWWRNTRIDSGLRLTKFGFDIFTTKLFLKRYTVSIEQSIKHIKSNPRVLLDLDRYLTCPYWFPPRKQAIIVFGEQEANMISLYNGDIMLYMKNTSAWN